VVRGDREMNAEQVRRLIAQGEGPRLEFKRSLAALQDGVRTIAAFANARPEPVEGPMVVSSSLACGTTALWSV